MPKDNFLLPVIELTNDLTIRHEALLFMDCAAWYNQIQMALKDQEVIAFRAPKDIFCYKVMPFALKNAIMTYQRVLQTIFDNVLHKIVFVVKLKT